MKKMKLLVLSIVFWVGTAAAVNAAIVHVDPTYLGTCGCSNVCVTYQACPLLNYVTVCATAPACNDVMYPGTCGSLTVDFTLCDGTPVHIVISGSSGSTTVTDSSGNGWWVGWTIDPLGNINISPIIT